MLDIIDILCHSIKNEVYKRIYKMSDYICCSDGDNIVIEYSAKRNQYYKSCTERGNFIE